MTETLHQLYAESEHAEVYFPLSEADMPQAEVLPPTYGELLMTVQAAAKERADDAVASEEFEFNDSPEVKAAVESYYSDHLKLAVTLEHVIDNPGWVPTEQDLEGQFTTFAMAGYAQRISMLNGDPANRERALREAQQVTETIMFNEPCVGATTLDEEELAILDMIGRRIKDVAVAEGLALVHPEGYSHWMTQIPTLPNSPPDDRSIGRARETREHTLEDFWADSRHAGQLLFHNTANLGAIASRGHTLMSRTKQLEVHGSYEAQTATLTAVDPSHSNAPHFSENYSYGEYKDRGDGGRQSQGTIAVPLANIIKTAPYARNNQYGIVELKDGSDEEKVTVNDGLGEIAEGGPDLMGKNGTDRVFYSDYRTDHAQEAHDYMLKYGRDGNSLLLRTEAEVRRDRDRGVNYGWGAGQYIPAVVTLPSDFHDRDFLEGHGFAKIDLDRERERKAGELAKLEAAINTLQSDSRHAPAFEGKVVVPLRSGVMEFKAEDNGKSERFGKFRQYAEHSIIDPDKAERF